MSKSYSTVRGMRDFLPLELSKRHFVEAKVRECFRFFGYQEIETPLIESHALIAAKSGNEIRHRLFAFTDFNGRKLALRPELTASVARVVTNKLRTQPKPIRLGYIANCFRYDNPQLGRYREFWQAGFEMFGSEHPIADAEIILANLELMRRVGLSEAFLKIGHVGILREILSTYDIHENEQNTIMGLIDSNHQDQVMKTFTELNVPAEGQDDIQQLFALKGTQLSVFEQGEIILNKYPDAKRALANLKTIVTLAQQSTVPNKIVIDLGFARGLEYYTGMIFEVYVPDLGIALGGGGRYDKLVEIFGGAQMPAVGCSPGIDRIVLAVDKLKRFPSLTADRIQILVIPVDQTTPVLSKGLEIATSLRNKDIIAHIETFGRRLRSALTYAGRQGYTHAIIIGIKELTKNQVTLRDLKAKTQELLPLNRLVQHIERS
ncbi:MAG: histidine--tRNA ligase [Candidatus Bathyarchaeota archaeon]|nr:histidine--tRNA ligase [Candidatus Bathyarchaeota archaeon]